MFRKILTIGCQTICIKQNNLKLLSNTSIHCQNLEPIQQLFVDRIREFAKKAKSANDELFEATQETKKALNDDLLKLERQYIPKGETAENFPSFKFEDPTLEGVGIGEIKSTESEKAKAEEKIEEDYRANKASWDV